MKSYSVLLLSLLLIVSANAQSDQLREKHVKVYEAADSIINQLYANGVDTLMAMHRVWAWEEQRNQYNNVESYSSLIFWADQGKYYYQRISEYAIYQPRRNYKDGLWLYLFRYYFINQKEIESNPIPTKLLSISDEGKSVRQLFYGGGDFNVLTYRMGKTSNQMYWYTPNLRMNDTYFDYEIFNLKSYIWSSLIEREFRKEINTYWSPINEKIESMENVTDFLGGMERELKKWQGEADNYKETHQYTQQEILIPKEFRGLIAIVQKMPCGKKIKIKNGIRTITIPDDGNLILDKKYIAYSQEYKYESEKKKTTAFFVKGSKREPLPLLRENSDPNDFGLSVLGDFSSTIDSQNYNIVVMYVGLSKEAYAMIEQKKYYNEGLPVLLKKKCAK